MMLDREKARQWVHGTLTVVRKLHDTDQESLLKKDFRVKCIPRSYIEVMGVLSEAEASRDLAAYYKPDKDPEQIIGEIINLVSKGWLVEHYSDAIDLMIKIDVDNKWRWGELGTALSERLQGDKVLEPDEIVGCAKAIVTLVENEVVPAKLLEQLSTIGHMMHHLQHAHAGKDNKAIALCLFLVFDFIPTGNVSQVIGDSPAGINIYNTILEKPKDHKPVVDNFTDLILRFGRVQSLIEKPNTAPNTKEIVKTVVEIIANREDGHEHITPTMFIEQYQDILGALPGEELRDFIVQLVEKADLLSVIMQLGFSKDFAGLHLNILRAIEGRDRAQYIGYLRSGLRELRKDDWVNELDQEGELLRLLLYIVENVESPGLSLSFKDALFDHAKKMIGEDKYVPDQEENWSKLPLVLSPEYQETFFSSLRDEIINRAEEKIDTVLNIYGAALLESRVLEEEKADDVVRTLFKGILEEGQAGELKWLLQAMNTTPQILNRCRESSRVEFRDRVIQSIKKKEDLSENAVDTIEKIARTIDINPEEVIAEEAKSEEDSNNKSS